MTPRVTPDAVSQAKSLCELFQASVTTNPDAVALRTPEDAVTITWREYSDDESTATCVLFVDQLLVTSKGAARQPHVGKERVTATLKNVDGTWLLDDIEPF